LAAIVVGLSKQDIVASPTRALRAIIDLDFMILCVYWLLYIGLI
jgi:hypothetical protein